MGVRRVVVLLALMLTACGTEDAVSGGDVPDRPPEITGTITSRTPFEPVTEGCVPAGDLDPDAAVSSDDPPVCTPDDVTVLGSVLVEAQPGVEGTDALALTVDGDTVLRHAGEDVTFADLPEGDVVRAWHTGVVAESYPGQARAEAIEVVVISE